MPCRYPQRIVKPFWLGIADERFSAIKMIRSGHFKQPPEDLGTFNGVNHARGALETHLSPNIRSVPDTLPGTDAGGQGMPEIFDACSCCTLLTSVWPEKWRFPVSSSRHEPVK